MKFEHQPKSWEEILDVYKAMELRYHYDHKLVTPQWFHKFKYALSPTPPLCHGKERIMMIPMCKQFDGDEWQEYSKGNPYTYICSVCGSYTVRLDNRDPAFWIGFLVKEEVNVEE